MKCFSFLFVEINRFGKNRYGLWEVSVLLKVSKNRKGQPHGPPFRTAFIFYSLSTCMLDFESCLDLHAFQTQELEGNKLCLLTLTLSFSRCRHPVQMAAYLFRYFAF